MTICLDTALLLVHHHTISPIPYTQDTASGLLWQGLSNQRRWTAPSGSKLSTAGPVHSHVTSPVSQYVDTCSTQTARARAPPHLFMPSPYFPFIRRTTSRRWRLDQTSPATHMATSRCFMSTPGNALLLRRSKRKDTPAAEQYHLPVGSFYLSLNIWSPMGL